MFHLACVRTIAWIDFDIVCYTILGPIQVVVSFLIEIFYKLNDFTFTVIIVFHLACVQTIARINFDHVCYTILAKRVFSIRRGVAITCRPHIHAA